ncbi:MAG: ATP-binding cassette domain-containing protein [Rhizobacter sp.]|nr:ATP-binding cassette domain-containing protein [Burkholderiales bacterium]
MADDVLLRLGQVSVVAGGKSLLSNINLEIQGGESVVVLGANGAGKTTLLKLFNGLVTPTRGTVQAPPASDQALIFQRPPYLARSVMDNVRFVLAMRGVVEPARTEQARAALVACDLGAIESRHAPLLSGGELQRLALARAWACRPKLLLADEPTSNLAPSATREVERLIQSVQAQGTTLLVTTHNVAQAKRLAHRILFLADGQIVEDRPAADFFASPQSAAARNYLEGESL